MWYNGRQGINIVYLLLASARKKTSFIYYCTFGAGEVAIAMFHVEHLQKKPLALRG
jgi:hypothetical protein